MATKGSTYIMTDYQKETIRQARKGYVPTKEHCLKISRALMGHPVTALTRVHIRRSRIQASTIL